MLRSWPAPRRSGSWLGKLFAWLLLMFVFVALALISLFAGDPFEDDLI